MQECKPAVDQEVWRWLPQSSSASADVTVFVYRKQSTYLRLDRALLMLRKDANLHLTNSAALASKKQLSVLSKAISRMSQYIPKSMAKGSSTGIS